MLSLDRQVARNTRRWVTCFYLRRLFRIYPLSVTAVAVVVALGIPSRDLGPAHLAKALCTRLTLFANLSLTQNFIRDADVLDPLWSLPFEVQMYWILPACYWYVRRRALSSSLSPMTLWVGFALLGSVISPQITKWNVHFSYWQIPGFLGFLPCFWAGVVAYDSMTKSPPRSPSWLLPAALAFLCFCWGFSNSEWGWWISTLLCACLVPSVRELERSWVTRICSVVARYSYGAYLFHYLAMWLGFAHGRQLPPLFQWTLFSLSLCLLCVGAYHLIEKPFIALGAHLAESWALAGSGDVRPELENVPCSDSNIVQT